MNNAGGETAAELTMGGIVILGIFVADVAFRARRQPKVGETIMGSAFALGPGGKGSNQAVAAARLGADVSFISKLGDDAFGKMAMEMWDREGVQPIVRLDPASSTGAAYIYIDEQSGDNAIIVVPGAAREVTPTDVEASRAEIESAALFMTQLETPTEAAQKGLEIARSADVTTVLNPAPAAPIGNDLLSLCDFLTPNETEAAFLTGISIDRVADASRASAMLRDRGAAAAIVTLGENGAFFDDGHLQKHIEPFSFGKVVETTGAGDSFCGAFAHALTTGYAPQDAAGYACAAATISVTRPGTAPSMPTAAEADNFYSAVRDG